MWGVWQELDLRSGASAGLLKSSCFGSSVSVARYLWLVWSTVCLVVSISEFQRGRKEKPHGEKKQESNKAPSLAHPAHRALQAPRFQVESTPFPWQRGRFLRARGSRRLCPSCSVSCSEKSKVRACQGRVHECFGRGISQVTP